MASKLHGDAYQKLLDELDALMNEMKTLADTAKRSDLVSKLASIFEK